MAQPVNLADITAMTIDDRIALVQAIWDSITAETDPIHLTEPQTRRVGSADRGARRRPAKRADLGGDQGPRPEAEMSFPLAFHPGRSGRSR